MHRDIKPENFFIDHNGHIVLGDFGLSHTPKPKKKFEKAPTYGLCGTSSYLAPEMLNDALLSRHGYKYKVDIFSLGVTFVEVLGRLSEPLYCAMDQNQQRAVMNDLGVDIVKKFIKDPDQLDLVLKMIDEDPNRRPDTQEIMKHAFFKDIDWEMVYNHQYQRESILFESYQIGLSTQSMMVDEYTHPRFRQNSIGMQSNP
ncbi:kinase-like protein [Wolfiporia cocos MD-104 SS10]|uniref:Kinase-like protein n=1 Tax=Wolfiporia cocos (strain MD-104) TaxID=742152 RepID=A0A2H3JFB4_WOLCO|nr:kinase-like protein [Wolfiporia cocos MD-104 SS10]